MKPTLNSIALLALIMAVALEVFLFAASRQDPNLRIAALVAGTNLVSAIAAIASTLLTGKDLTHPSDLPPNSAMQQTTSIQTPADPNVPK